MEAQILTTEYQEDQSLSFEAGPGSSGALQGFPVRSGREMEGHDGPKGVAKGIERAASPTRHFQDFHS